MVGRCKSMKEGISMLFYVITFLVVVLDQISKYLIRSYVRIGDTFALVGIPFTHIENSGMARSLFQGYGRFFGAVAILFVIGVLYYRNTSTSKSAFVDIGQGFLVGGAVGNATDRLLFGQVTDFILTRSGHGVLNLADYAIEIGIFLLFVYAFIRFLRKKAARARDRSQ
jgi:signal peptidase II